MQILNRWIRLNDDICSQCNTHTWVRFDVIPNPPKDAHPIITTVSCQCGHLNAGEHCAGWAQMDNVTVEKLIELVGGQWNA